MEYHATLDRVITTAHQISFHEVVDLGKHLRFVTVYLMEQVHGS